jgi:sensor c-di-GMP phosphodiesterase-like protein
MGRKVLAIGIVLIVMLGITLPVALSIYLARKEAVNAEKFRAHSYAVEVLARSDKVADQIDNGIKKLVAAHFNDPCSAASQDLMKRIDLSSSYIQAVGYVSNNKMICSSVGAPINGFALGSVDIVHPSGVKLRLNVEFSFAKGVKFLIVERDGFAAVIHKGLLVDVATDTKAISFAIVAYPERQVLSTKGVIQPEWVRSLNGTDTAFIDRGYVVATAVPKRYMIAAICAIPVTVLNQRIYSTLWIVIPVGLLVSVLVALVVLYWAKARMAMPALIRSALKSKEFFIEYQPVVDLATGRWVGAEALVRWRRNNGEIIKPDIFIPAAEDCGLIQQLTRYVTDQIAAEVMELFQRCPNFHLGINLAAPDLHDEETVLMMRNLAAATGARRNNIIVEATERCITRYDVASGVIKKLREEGFPIAIDDFGTGYSNLSYLERIKVDYLKIDKSFVDTLSTNVASNEVILHIIEMAKSLKLKMIAEGVENEVQAQFLRERGVQYAQGWFYAQQCLFPS